MDADETAWGETVVRRPGPVPFLVYERRRRHVADLMVDAARWRDREHLVQGDRRLTYGQVLSASRIVAGELEAAGVRPGDRVLLLAPNSPEWVISYWGAIGAGAVVALGNGWWSRAEVQHAVSTVRPALTISGPRHLEDLAEEVAQGRVIGIETVRTWTEGAAAPGFEPAVPERSPEVEDEPAVIVFTAGTTGAAKAVTLAHRSIIANLHNLLLVSRRLPQHQRDDRPPMVILASGPLFHIGGIQSLMLAFLSGNTVVFLEGRFDAGQVMDLIEREKVTVWGAVPTMVSRVLEHPSLPARDLSRVRSISLGGAPVHAALAERLRQAFPGAKKGVSTIYGLTETGGTLASASGEMMAEHPSTAGRPLPVVELRIDNPDESGSGEIVARTPAQMLGYWGEVGSDVIEPDGWLHTGDVGRLEDGLLYVTGRLKDIVIRGGENIAAVHVESILHRHPAVAAAAVIGLPDDDLGERVGAVIQFREGMSAGEAELAEFAGGHLARFEVPDRWWLLPGEIPMTDAGKPDKRRLRREWAARLGSGD